MPDKWWAHLDRFAALRNPAVTPGPVAALLGRSPDHAVYGVADGRLWRSPSDSKRVVRNFLRLSYGPSDRNIVDLYADAGVTPAAPFARRDGDKAGVAIGVARPSHTLRAAARALLRSGQPATRPPAFESVAELSYRAAVVGPLKLQPDIQNILHPAESALAVQVLGLRSTPGHGAPGDAHADLRTAIERSARRRRKICSPIW